MKLVTAQELKDKLTVMEYGYKRLELISDVEAIETEANTYFERNKGERAIERVREHFERIEALQEYCCELEQLAIDIYYLMPELTRHDKKVKMIVYRRMSRLGIEVE